LSDSKNNKSQPMNSNKFTENMTAVTVFITRTARCECWAAFERTLHDFVQRSLALLHEQLAVQVARPPANGDVGEYSIIFRFANRQALSAFVTSYESLAWNHTALDLTEGAGRARELTDWRPGEYSYLTPIRG
jgi:antibiotic biosynthesis monooxygenase (ABM) superfamily enzyme